MELQNLKRKNSIQMFVNNFLLFFFIYDIYKSALPTVITSRRMVILIGLGIIVVRNLGKLPISKLFLMNKYLKSVWYLNGIVLLYSTILYMFIGRGDGHHILNDSIVFIYVVLGGCFVFFNLYNNFNDFISGLLTVTLIQAVIIFMFFFMPSLQNISDSFFEFPEYALIFRARGYYTGISCAGAPGMFKLIPGIFACIYFLQEKNKSVVKYGLYFVFISVASIIIARSGLVIVLIGLIMLVMIRGKDIGVKKKLKIVFLFIFLFLIALIVIYVYGLNDALSSVFWRLLRLKEVGLYEGFFKFYIGRGEFSHSVLPPIIKETIIGTGITSGTSANGITIIMDGGYARLYVALGLPMAIVFYILFFTSIFKSVYAISDVIVRKSFLFLAICYPICEFKEYFIYSNYLLCIYLSVYLLYFKEASNCEI